MPVQKFSAHEARFERSPGQSGDVYAGNVVDKRDGSPLTLGFGKYGPNQRLEETMAVDDVMVIIHGSLSVSSEAGTVTAGPGEMIHMPKGEKVVIVSHDEGATTAYVTYPHWKDAE